MLCSPGGFQIWRRDVLEEVGGYSTLVHVRGHRAHVPHPRAVPARGPRLRDPLPPGQRRRDRGAGRRREARVAARALAARHQRDRLCTTGGCGSTRATARSGMVGAPFYLLTEVLSPAIELLALASLAAAVFLGSSISRCSSSSSRRWRSSTPHSPRARSFSTTCSRGSIACATSRGCSFWAPFDLVLYRPIIVWARFKGSWRFLRGDKAWHKFERNVARGLIRGRRARRPRGLRASPSA